MKSFWKNVFVVFYWAFVICSAVIAISQVRWLFSWTPEPRTNWTADVNNMTTQEMVDYIRFTNASSCKLERDFGGNVDGNKSVCLDPEVRPEPGNCIVYSFGVHHEWTFDEEMARYGCHVYAFDPLIKKNHNRSEKIHVYNFGLSYKSQTSMQNWTVHPLHKIYKMLQTVHGKVPISYLRYDLEDYDLKVLPNIIRTGVLMDIRQLALEVHIEPEAKIDMLRDLVEVLQVKMFFVCYF